MDPITQQTVIAAAGAGGGDPLYVDDVFSTYLYDGNGGTQTINNGIDLSGEGGLVLLKKRSSSSGTVWTDTARGANKHLRSDLYSAEYTETNILTAFNSNGFSIGNEGDVNSSGQTFASWSFRKAPGFFDVVTYSGNDVAGRGIAHNLGSVPGCIIVKAYSADADWHVYHRSVGTGKFLTLNSSGPTTTNAGSFSTTPTSTVFYPGTSENGSGYNYVAYIFAHDDASFGTDSDESIIKCGSYTGTGSTDQTINLGFEPQWIMIKNTTTSGGWQIFDVMRGMGARYSGNSSELLANTTVVENAGTRIHPEANGFSFQGESSVRVNSSGDTFAYMAIRRPHKPPTAATEVFAVDYGNSSSTIPCWDSGFPVDLAFWTYWNSTYAKQALSRLTGTKYLYTNATDAEANDPDLTWDSNLGWGKTWNTNTISWMFKRAPGFMDVVAYSGTGSTTTFNHNLTVEPELIMVKCRSHSENWAVYSSALGATKYLRINTNDAANTSNIFWNDTAPTSSVFTVYPYDGVNGSGKTYIAYLFATLPGISKVGSYTGTGSAQNIDCGFTSGARFVLIKRTNSNGNWVLFDSTRGIVSGNDPYLRLNSTQVQITDEDHVDPLNAGFTVTTHGDVNTSGGNYIFLAIA